MIDFIYVILTCKNVFSTKSENYSKMKIKYKIFKKCLNLLLSYKNNF